MAIPEGANDDYCCDYVNCSENHSHIARLVIQNKDLKLIIDNLSKLDNLEILELGNMEESSSIPSGIGKLRNLKKLIMYGSKLTGEIPSEIGQLSNLRELELTDTGLTGSIPKSIGNLSNLQRLYLSRNELSGSIPNEIGNLSELKLLLFENCGLTGSIPKSIGRLENLEGLYSWNNQLTGSIPNEIGNLSKLHSLVLENGQLRGSIPSSIKNLRLEQFSVNNNCISCSEANDIMANTCTEMRDDCPIPITIHKCEEGTSDKEYCIDGSDSLSGLDLTINDNLKNIIIETCNEEGTCVRTSGIIKQGESYYKISETDNGNASYDSISGDSCSGNIGGMATIDNKKVLCLTESIYVPFTEDDAVDKYIMKKGTISPFDIDGGGKDIAITVGSFIYAFDKSLTDEVFSDHKTNKILSRDANICSGDLINTMYECTYGVCSEKAVVSSDGIYLHTADSQLYKYGANGWEKVKDKSGVMAFKKLDDCSDSIRLEVRDKFEPITSAEDIVLQICTNGKCEGANGFVKYNTDLKSLAKCTAGSCEGNVNIALDGGCTSDNVGKANYGGTDLKICTVAADNTYKFEVIDPDVKKILHLTANANEYSTYEFDSTETKNALAILDNNLEGYYVINDNTIVTQTGENDNYKLVLCTKAGGCVEQTTVGYYVNAGDKSSDNVTYIKCTYKDATSNACQVIAAPSGVSCESGKVGLLTSDIKLCLGTKLEGGTDYLTSGTFDADAKYYLINNSENNANTYNGAIGNNEKGLIKITSNAMIFDSVSTISNPCLNDNTLEITDNKTCDGGTKQKCSSGKCVNEGEFDCDLEKGEGADCSADGYLLINDQSGKKTLITANDKQGDLYYCKSGSGCDKVTDRGYIVDTTNNKYFVCKGGAKCKRYEFAENCSSGNIGKLIGSASSDVYLCLNNSGSEGDTTGITAKLEANSGRYVVPTSTNTKYAFGVDGHDETIYYMVDVYPKKVLFKKNFISSVLYVYAYQSTHKVVKRGDATCTTTDKMEFEYEAGVCTKRTN